MTPAPRNAWTAMPLVWLAALVAAGHGTTSADGGQPTRAGQGRLRRDNLGAHLSRSSLVEDLLVLDTSSDDPDDAPVWTGLTEDGVEIAAMPARLRVSFELHGEPQRLDVALIEARASPSYRELVLEIPHGTNGLPANLTDAFRAASPGDDDTAQGRAGRFRSRRAGPRRRRTALDCLYHGTTAAGTVVSLSACELPLQIHATIHAPHFAESFEIQPLGDGGGHVAFYIADLAGLAENTTQTCGNSPSGGEHTGAHEHGREQQGPAAREAKADPPSFADPSDRSRRQTCTKTVEVLIVNDNALYSRNGAGTESFSLAVFNELAAIYANGGFSCNVQIRLIGQITFRHGNPAEIVHNTCDQRWHYASLPSCWTTNPCQLPNGADVLCLAQPSGCDSGDLNGCRSSSSGWATCGDRRLTTIYQQASGGQCLLGSSSPDEVDTGVLRKTFDEWITAHHAELESTFGNDLDNAVLLSGTDFAGSTVGQAGLGTMCGSDGSSSITMSTSKSAFQVAMIVAHEMGHNFGLNHVGSGWVMSGTSSGGEDGSWNWVSKRDLNNALGSQTCLDDNIQGVSGPFCGDGIVEGDEECDPGVGFADACCTSSCALAPGCVCPITDPCCNDDGSGFQSQGTLCRAATHPTCDVPEFCSGSSSVCPQDGAADAGVSCTSWPVGGKCYNGGCHAPLGCSWSAFQYFWEAKRNTCLEQCTSVDLLANPFSGYSFQTMSYGPDGTPCGDGRQCVSAGPGDAGEFCVTSASLNVGNPTPPPTPSPLTEFRSPTTSPITVRPTPAPTPAPAPTGPPTRFAYCLEGYGDYGVRYNWGIGKITIATSHEACSARCSQYSGPEFNGGCKAYQTGMYFGFLYCRSYGGNLRTTVCAPWAVPTNPGYSSGALGSRDGQTGNVNVGGNCCSNTTFVVQTTPT